MNASHLPLPMTVLALACGSLVAAATDKGSPSLTIPLVVDPKVVGIIPTQASSVPVEAQIVRDSVWGTDYEAALDQALRENKRVLLNFTGSDWCGWCVRLEADVFAKPEFKAYAAQRLVLVKVDFPRKKRLPEREVAQNARLQQQFGVTGFPTIVLIDAKTRKSAVIPGYVRGGPKAFIAAVEKTAGR